MFHKSSKLRRDELIKKNEIPMHNEIKQFLGSNLAKILCEFSHPSVKKCLGTTTSLYGDNNELWESPSDQLIEKNCLKPPPNEKYIKACTHYGILQLGEKVKRKWEMEIEKKISDNLKSNLKNTRQLFDAEKRHATNLAIHHTKLLYESRMNKMTDEYEQKIEYAIAIVEKNCNAKLKEILIHERINVTREMMKKLRDEIGYVVTSLCDEFDRQSQAQKEIMITEFSRILRQHEEKADSELNFLNQQRIEDLKRLRIELNEEFKTKKDEIISAEQMNIKAQQYSLHQCFQKKIEALEDLLLEAKYVIELFATSRNITRSWKQPPWRRKICEIIRQFKKFTTLIFKDLPGQAEIIELLELIACKNIDAEDSASFHTTNSMNRYTIKTEENTLNKSYHLRTEKFQVVEIIDKNGEKWRPIQLLPNAPQLYCTEEQLLSSIIKSEIDICHDDNYIHKDLVASASTATTTEKPPIIHFENKLYVRSDHKPDIEESSAEIKTMGELAEGSQFIMGLNDSTPYNFIIKDIRDDPSALVCNEKQKPNEIETKYITFKTRVQNLIDAIQREKCKSLRDEKQSTRSNDDEHVCDLIYDFTTTFHIDENSPIEESSPQFACSRVKSLIKTLRLHPSLQHILLHTINNI